MAFFQPRTCESTVNAPGCRTLALLDSADQIGPETHLPQSHVACYSSLWTSARQHPPILTLLALCALQHLNTTLFFILPGDATGALSATQHQSENSYPEIRISYLTPLNTPRRKSTTSEAYSHYLRVSNTTGLRPLQRAYRKDLNAYSSTPATHKTTTLLEQL